MKISSFLFYSDLSSEQKIIYECSDRLLLPYAYMKESNVAIDDSIMLTNILEQIVCGTIFSFHSKNDNIIYAPSWMIHSIDSFEIISLSMIVKKQPTALVLKLHSEKIISCPNFITFLNIALRNYKSLTKNSRIDIIFDGQLEFISIDDILPSNISTCFVFNCGNVDTIIKNFDQASETKLTYLYKKNSHDYKFSFIGKSNILGGIIEPSMTPELSAADAVRRRMIITRNGFSKSKNI